MAEIDLQIDLKVYRTVFRGSLDSLDYASLHEFVGRRIASWGQRSPTTSWTLKYKNVEGELRPVTNLFPRDTDGAWREFFAAVFYVDF